MPEDKMTPEANIGLVGHVAHGKTTLTRALTGRLTLAHSEELKRGITIRLGYADATIYRKKDGTYTTDPKEEGEAVRTVSFVDAPGHETLMATVLSGASLMDGAVLMISAVEKCPQPQTREHLAALEVVGIKNVVVVQNKVDLVSPERAKENHDEIREFLKGTIIEGAPVIPVSAQHGINIDAVLAAIQELIPTPERDPSKDPRMLVARSFDVNKPGTSVKKLTGGVLGGAIVQGEFKVGDDIEMRPGMRVGSKYQKISSKITGLKKGGKSMERAGPGGLIGLMTSLDPFVSKSDSLVGNVIGSPGRLPEVRDAISMEMKTLKRLVESAELKGMGPPKVGENMLLNIAAARSVGEVAKAKGSKLELRLKIPVAADVGDRVVVSRMVNGRWRLVGYGIIS